MALNYGFSYGLENNEEAKTVAAHRFNRLHEWEKEFFHADPFMSLSFCLMMLSADVRTVTASSVPIIVHRLLLLDTEAMIWLCIKIAKDLVRDDDPEEFRTLCAAYSENPLSNRYFNRNSHKAILKHWFLERFGGSSTNIAMKSDAEWMKKLAEDQRYGGNPKYHRGLNDIISKERKELFEKFSKEPVIA